MKHWYVVSTHARGEARAEQHLRNQDFEAYLPRYRKQRRHARKVDVVLAPLFPRYIFVRLDLDMQRWRSVNGTQGVSHIICCGETPAPVPEGIVECIMARENDAGAVMLAPRGPVRGDVLRITEGALADQIGLFEEMVDEKRAILLLDLMGREVRITADVENLAAAS